MLKALLFFFISSPPLSHFSLSPFFPPLSVSLLALWWGWILLRQMHRQKGITFTVLSEDKFVYAPTTDIPPDKETTCIMQSYHGVARNTLIICNPARGAYACWQKHTYAYIMKAREFRRLGAGAGGRDYYILKRHNIKTGDSELKSGSLRRRESSLNRTHSFKTVTAWIGEKKKRNSLCSCLISFLSELRHFGTICGTEQGGIFWVFLCAHTKKTGSRSTFSRINIVTTKPLKGPH